MYIIIIIIIITAISTNSLYHFLLRQSTTQDFALSLVRVIALTKKLWKRRGRGGGGGEGKEKKKASSRCLECGADARGRLRDSEKSPINWLIHSHRKVPCVECFVLPKFEEQLDQLYISRITSRCFGVENTRVVLE